MSWLWRRMTRPWTSPNHHVFRLANQNDRSVNCYNLRLKAHTEFETLNTHGHSYPIPGIWQGFLHEQRLLMRDNGDTAKFPLSASQ